MKVHENFQTTASVPQAARDATISGSFYSPHEVRKMNDNTNTRVDNYREFFTKEYLMGPNSMRLLDEMLRKYPLKAGSRVMDLGCGMGITSLFLAREANVNVFATDLWIPATQNAENFRKWGIDGQVIPIHADATDLPYAEGYFDAIVSIDAFHYFAAKKGFFREKILPYLKHDGVLIVAMPGLKNELEGEPADNLLEWMEGSKDDYDTFHCRKWWLDLIGEGEDFEVVMDFDLDCFDEAWDDWFRSGHEYGIKDRAFFDRGMGEYLSFIGLVIRRK